jgi:hypothetical protein
MAAANVEEVKCHNRRSRSDDATGGRARVLAWFASWPDEVKVLAVVLVFLWVMGEWSFQDLYWRGARWVSRWRR